MAEPDRVWEGRIAALDRGIGFVADRRRRAGRIRSIYMLATKMRDEMRYAGRRAELDELLATARILQEELLNRTPT